MKDSYPIFVSLELLCELGNPVIMKKEVTTHANDQKEHDAFKIFGVYPAKSH